MFLTDYLDDLKKLIYTQNLSFKINIDKIPISKNLSNFLKIKKKDKINFYFFNMMIIKLYLLQKKRIEIKYLVFQKK